ncbi:sigma-70 family RNA polymerase sigma factor [Pseudonocardia endophytica]|uniref:RNA polymerase sigma-70 factor (ECF subfamily) n=1 Tax=Pseudonocardia endophytica TaxID=401976 RepID=A0A4R1IB78_PSEEN|nr:sigma-70 family RNA polymerase sigma factor [Pseudonocardia endophytica]TCK27672.1 RNA polymerase sigma-70 factor (ECF subfamily) [Pseudonocardia endophytica]
MTTSTGPGAARRGTGPSELDELFRTHRDRLWSVAVRTLGNRADAEDAVQETFVAALRSGSGGFRGEADPGTWLYRILMNKCIDRMRAHPEPDVGQDTSPDPVGGVATRLVVDEALGLLPPEQRAAVVLVDVHGWPVAEAARILDVAEGTVKSRCARGRSRLLELLGHLREEP